MCQYTSLLLLLGLRNPLNGEVTRPRLQHTRAYSTELGAETIIAAASAVIAFGDSPNGVTLAATCRFAAL